MEASNNSWIKFIIINHHHGLGSIKQRQRLSIWSLTDISLHRLSGLTSTLNFCFTQTHISESALFFLSLWRPDHTQLKRFHPCILLHLYVSVFHTFLCYSQYSSPQGLACYCVHGNYCESILWGLTMIHSRDIIWICDLENTTLGEIWKKRKKRLFQENLQEKKEKKQETWQFVLEQKWIPKLKATLL